MKKQLEMYLAKLRKQKSETKRFSEILKSELDTAQKVNFTERISSLKELSSQESSFEKIIDLKIEKTLNSLKKFN